MDRRIEIEIPVTPMRLVEHGSGVVAVTDQEMPVLTAEMVRDTLEHAGSRVSPRTRHWRPTPC